MRRYCDVAYQFMGSHPPTITLHTSHLSILGGRRQQQQQQNHQLSHNKRALIKGVQQKEEKTRHFAMRGSVVVGACGSFLLC